jgi:pimeloyl-ACP methyl ester carboxylesterase
MRAPFLNKRGEATVIILVIIAILSLLALFKPTITGLITENASFENATLILNETAPNISEQAPQEIAPVETPTAEIAIETTALTKQIKLKDSKGNELAAEIVYEASEVAASELPEIGRRAVSIKVNVGESSVKEIKFKDLNVDALDEEISLGIDSVPEENIELNNAVNVYAIDPTQLDFTEATVTAVAQGEELWKCKDWDFASQQCLGSWTKLMDITPGQEYSFALTPQDPAYAEVRTQVCLAEDNSNKGSFSPNCDGIYPSATCGTGADLLSCNDGLSESHTTDGSCPQCYAGIQVTLYNSSVTNCTSIRDVFLCYEWWGVTGLAPTDCDISVDNQNGTNFTAATVTCPGVLANPGVTCVNVTGLKGWSCSNFFGASGVRAEIKSELSRTTGGNKLVYWDVLFYNVTYAAAVPPDTTFPSWSNNKTFPVSPATYSPTGTYQFNTTWTDNIAISAVQFEHNFTGTAANYSATGNALSEYYYNYGALAAGEYYWKSWANDTSNNINSTLQFAYAVNKAASSINLLLNGVAGNITAERKSSVNKTATLVTPAAGAVELYEQGALIASGSSPLTNISAYNSNGLFNITSVYPATQNYTTSSISRFITVQDTIPPGGVANLANQSQTTSSIYWSWTNPADDDFNHTEVWLDGVFKANISAPLNYYNATGLLPSTNYTIQTKTADNYGNVNGTWVNNTAQTLFAPDTTSPTAIALSPPDNAVDVDGNITFNCSATDNANLKNISLYFMGGLNQTAVVSGASATANFSLLGLANGNYNWYCRAFDTTGNGNITETRNFTVDIPALPIYTNYTGQGNTTDWASAPDITNVCNGTAILDQPPTDMIVWPGCVNASAQNFDLNVVLGYNNVTVLTSGLNPTFNSTATITMRNLPWDAPPVIYMNGVLCFEPDCSNVSYSNGTAMFNVSHFTSIVTGTNSRLVLWDETDTGMAYAGFTRYKNEQITFFANYTRTSNGNFISGATCNINFTDTGAITMAENATKSLYEYNRSFASAGVYLFSVICSKGGSNTLSTTDNTTVTADITFPSWTNNKTSPASPVTYSPAGSYQFNMTWTDNIALDTAYFEHNFTGTAANYTPTGFVGNTTNREYYYNYGALPAGTYYWKSWANDTSNNLNFTDAFSYFVNKTASSINLLLNGNDANITINQHTVANITAYLVSPTAGYIEIYQNGTLINSGQSPLTNLTNYTTVGTYNITAIYPATQNYTSSYETHFLTISEVDTQAPNWTNAIAFPASPATYSPTASYQFNTTWTDNFAVTTVLFEHNFTGTAANYTATGNAGSVYYYNYGALPAGTYYWKSWASDAVGNWNVTSMQSYVVNQAASSLSLTITPSNSVTYGTATTANCTASTTQITPQLYRNGTSAGASYETAALAAGSYNYSCNASATQNYTAPAEQSSILSVNKNATATELWLNGARSDLNISYPEQINASAITSALFVALLRNGTNVDAENGVYASLAAGSYNYTAINYGDENYTGSSESWLLTINKNTTSCSLAVDPVSGQTWPVSVNASCSCTNPEAAAKLWRNNADVTATENSIFTLLPAGNWSYMCNATATQNYTYAENASSHTINKAASSINLLLSDNDANFSTTNATQVNITAELATPATGNIAIYENGALLDSGSSPRTVLKIYHTPAVYNITAVYPATQNYSSSYETHFLEITVADLTPPIITGHDAKPRVIIAGRNVTINTTVADNVAVDKLWAVITRPDLTTQTIYPPALFATTIDGTYNITFYANDSSGNNAAPATDYFIAAAPLNFTITVIDANSTGIETTLTDYFPGTDEQIDLENFTGGETIEEPNYIFDLLFSSYNDALQARLNSVNLSANNNLTLGMDKLPTPTSSYIVSYALNRSSFNFTNAILKLSYAGASYSNEANLRVYKCDSWDFANRVCTGAFALLPDAVQNMAGKYFTVNVTSFSGFSIKEETLVVPPSGGVRHPAPPSEAPSAPPVVPPEAAPTVAPPVVPPEVTPPAVEQPAEIVPASIDEIVPGTTLAVAPEITGKVSCGFITNAVSPQIEAKAVDASVLRLIKIPAGYEMIDQFKLDCSGDNLEVTLNLPEGYTDVKALGCRQGQCTEVEGVVNRNSMICGGKTIGELVDQKITKIKEIINPEEFAVLQSQSKTITSQSRVVFSGKNSIEFAGEIPSEITATVGSPKTAIPAPKNYGALIMGTPLVLQLSKRLYSNAIITMPILDVAGFEQDSLEIYALQNNEWTLIGGRQDKIARTITAQIENISSYLDIENKVTFAVIGVKCKACAVASFDKLYNGAGSRNALVLVHGLFADEHPFGPLIEELSYNSQPWQIWRFMYPTSLTVEEIAEQLSDSLESHVGEYDSIYLIGHSLGGIVVQRAVADANERQLEWLAKVGKVVLTGTPNDGSPAKEIYSRLFNSLVNLDTAAKLFDINSDIIQTITQPQNMPLVKGIDYQVVAGIHGYDFTADLFSAGQKNDGIITTTSAQHVGGSYINNSCSNYYEINITHTDLNDNPVAVRVLERIINKDLAKQNTNKVYVGYNQYFKIAVKGCSSQDAYVLIGKKIKEEKAPDPINCNCGNGWCGVDETPDNCPVDCARPVTTESICLFLPVIICIPVIIIAALLLIAGILWISNKKPGMLNKPLAVFAIIALAISFYQYITCKEFTLLSIIINAAKSLFATTTALVIAIVAVAAILLILFIRYFGANAQRIFHRKEMHELDIRQQRLERLNAILERKIQMHLQKKEGK